MLLGQALVEILKQEEMMLYSMVSNGTKVTTYGLGLIMNRWVYSTLTHLHHLHHLQADLKYNLELLLKME